MIRPFTLITMLLAALSGAYLFAVKHRAQVLDDEIAAFNQRSREDAMRIRVLQGQWSLETDPTRLQQLAAQFTSLQPMQPAQLVTLAALRDGLPPAGSAAPASNPALPQAAPLAIPASAPQDSGQEMTQSAGTLPLPPPPAPVMLADLPPPRASSPAVRHPVSHSALHLANTELAEALPPPKPYAATLPLSQGSESAELVPVKAISAPQYVPEMASQDGGSVLGMASNLPPPQPMPQTGNDN